MTAVVANLFVGAVYVVEKWMAKGRATYRRENISAAADKKPKLDDLR